MKKTWKRWLAAGTVLLMLNSLPGIPAFAAELDKRANELETEENGNETNTEEAFTETTESTEILGQTITDYILNYIYFEATELAPGQEQVIVVNIENIDQMAEQIKEFRLGYQLNGREGEIICSERDENLLIFRQNFQESGKYQILYVDIITETETSRILFADCDVEASFLVNDELSICDEIEQSQEMKEYTEIPVVEIGSEIMPLSGEAMAISVSEVMPMRARNGNIVVVLDPGHDGLHAGAAGNGLNEEVLTLKIAQYCKAELEQYNNVTVYMTRNDGSCPDSRSNGYCMQTRCSYAASVGADILVSIHIDAGSATRSGAMVIVAANGVYRDDLSTVTHAIGQEILDELSDIGLASRGLYVRMSDDPDEEYHYPNGAVADWYSITRNSIKQGIPGIIVEHGFISNPSDAATWFRSEDKLKALGVADATGIAQYFGLRKGNSITDAMRDESDELYTDTGDTIASFVASLYQSVLERTPTRAEVSWWVAKVEQDRLTGSGLVKHFVNSEEFQNKGYSDEEYVEKLYEIFLGRASEPEGKAYWVDRLKSGDSRLKIAELIGNSPEFELVCARYGIAQGSHSMQYVKLYPKIADFVAEYYQGLMNREPDSEGLEYWTKSLILGNKTAADITKGFITSQEFQNRNISKSDFVEGIYQTYLGRSSDPEGKDYWMGRLGTMSYQEKCNVIRGFIRSEEYRLHCDELGIAVGNF